MVNNKIFISYSFEHRKEFILINAALINFLKQKGFNPYSFVFDFKKKVDNKGLMKAALKKIDESDLILVELSYNKSIGIGLEAGYAKAKNKKIVYIHKKGTGLSNTVDGISDIRIEYKNINNLLEQLKNVF